jgi:hypothetical protein
MTRKVKVLVWLLSGPCSWIFLPGSAQAATLNVNCNGSSEDQLTTIGKALKLLKPEGPNTINVSGSCHENVLIQSFENLTLNAISGASITDASSGAGTVVDIEDSTDVTLQGLTINGGDIGVFCGDLSVCRFKNNTIQNATVSVSGDGVGVWVGRSRATFDGDVVQHNSGPGVIIGNGSTAYGVNIQANNNGLAGIRIAGSFFTGDPASFQNNGTVGVRVLNHSTFNLFAGAITGNAGSGVTVQGASMANIQSGDGPTNISSNGGNGVEIHDLSFAIFVNGEPPPPPLTITGNAAPDVNCFQLSYSAQGATTDIGGGTTNCTEPR